jgi:hypothetical protein
MAGNIHSDPDNWLRTGLTDARLRNIGVITVIWNSVEFDLQEIITALLGCHPEVGLFITSEMQNVSRYQLAKNLSNRNLADARLKEDVLRALEFFELCRMRRNVVVHAMPVYDEDKKELSGRMAKVDAKRGSGEIRFTHYRLDDKYIEALTWDLHVCRQALTDAKRKVTRASRYLHDPKVQEEASWDSYVFEYSKEPLDTVWLQKRLDQLRSVHPNQDTPEHPPLPSRA